MINAHWPADPWHQFSTDEMIARLRAMDAKSVVFPLYHDLHIISPAHHQLMLLDLERLAVEGIEVTGRLMWVGRPPEAAEYVGSWERTIGDAMARGLTVAVIHNEPNLRDGGEGWGDSDEDAVNFCRWFAAVCRLLSQRWPTLRRVFPGLAVNHRDIEWLSIATWYMDLPDLRSLVHAWGVHIYWQDGHDGSIDWGQRHYLYRAAIGDSMPLWCLEFGDSTEGKPIEAKAAEYCRWAADAPEWLEKRICFTLGGAGWETFILSQEACNIIGEYNRAKALVAA